MNELRKFEPRYLIKSNFIFYFDQKGSCLLSDGKVDVRISSWFLPSGKYSNNWRPFYQAVVRRKNFESIYEITLLAAKLDLLIDSVGAFCVPPGTKEIKGGKNAKK